jgi:hypothetical protein
MRIDHDNYSRGHIHGCAHARNRKSQREIKRTEYITRYYTVPYSKYRSESIKLMVRTRKEPGRANEICDLCIYANTTYLISLHLSYHCIYNISSSMLGHSD